MTHASTNTAYAPSPQSKGWSPERRAKHAAAIRKWKPWAKSTGPRTAAGKARAAQNAAKPHLKLGPDQHLERALRAHGRYLTGVEQFMRLKKSAEKNELLKRHVSNARRRLIREGQKATMDLYSALIFAKLCKNLDFYEPLPLKVNSNDN